MLLEIIIDIRSFKTLIHMYVSMYLCCALHDCNLPVFNYAQSVSLSSVFAKPAPCPFQVLRLWMLCHPEMGANPSMSCVILPIL